MKNSKTCYAINTVLTGCCSRPFPSCTCCPTHLWQWRSSSVSQQSVASTEHLQPAHPVLFAQNKAFSPTMPSHCGRAWMGNSEQFLPEKPPSWLLTIDRWKSFQTNSGWVTPFFLPRNKKRCSMPHSTTLSCPSSSEARTRALNTASSPSKVRSKGSALHTQ